MFSTELNASRWNLEHQTECLMMMRRQTTTACILHVVQNILHRCKNACVFWIFFDVRARTVSFLRRHFSLIPFWLLLVAQDSSEERARDLSRSWGLAWFSWRCSMATCPEKQLTLLFVHARWDGSVHRQSVGARSCFVKPILMPSCYFSSFFTKKRMYVLQKQLKDLWFALPNGGVNFWKVSFFLIKVQEHSRLPVLQFHCEDWGRPGSTVWI